MEKKIVKKFIYEGFGFPVHLINVPMIKTRCVWTPDINYNQLQKALILSLAKKPCCLTGNEIKFIRKFFRKTLVSFGAEFGVSHVAVIDWEAEKNDPAKMNPATEKCIRLFVLDSLVKADKKFREGYQEIEIKQLAEQQKCRHIHKRRQKLTKLDIDELKIA